MFNFMNDLTSITAATLGSDLDKSTPNWYVAFGSSYVLVVAEAK